MKGRALCSEWQRRMQHTPGRHRSDPADGARHHQALRGAGERSAERMRLTAVGRSLFAGANVWLYCHRQCVISADPPVLRSPS